MENNSNAKHEYVDLGLSVKWATMNIGALKISDYGNYFSWGETCSKEDYTWGTYKHGTSADDLTKYNYDDNLMALESSDDAATTNWGKGWRIPSNSEWEELCNKRNCAWEWTNIDGTLGYKITSKITGYTKNSIFFRLQAISEALQQKGLKSLHTIGHQLAMTRSRIAHYACTLFLIS